MTTTLQSGLTLTVNAKVLREALLDLAPIYQKKSSNEILNSLHVYFGPGYIALTGNNLDQALTRYVPISACDAPADTFLLDYRKFKALLKGKRGTVTIDCSLARCYDKATDEYPTPPTVKGEEFTLSAEAIAAIHRSLYAASSDEKRYIMCGIYLDEERQAITSTDGRRLHMEQVPPCAPRACILPSMGPSERLLRRLPECPASAILGARAIRFEWAGWGIYWSRLVEGNYPNYSQVMPKDDLADLAWIRTTDALRQAVDYVCSIRKEFEVKHLKLTIQDADLRLQAISEGGGTAFDKTLTGIVLFNPIEPSSWETEGRPEPLRIAFNPVFLREGIEDTDVLYLKDELSPALIHSAASARIIMPLRLN